jgi:hypothetical protein
MEVQTLTPDVVHEYWTLYFDGSVMGPDAGAGMVLISPEGKKLCLRNPSPLSSLKQHRQIRGPYQWPQHGHLWQNYSN